MKPSIRLHHGGISVKDMEQSITFYRDVFGFDVDTQLDVSDDFSITHMKLGDSYIELFWHRNYRELPAHAQSLDTDLPVIGTKHIAFETDDLEGMYKWLVSQGVEMVGDIRSDNPGYTYFFFKDINGILLEFVQPKT